MTQDEFYTNLNQANELYHHGVKGQKWGVRKKMEERKIARSYDYKKSDSYKNATRGGKSAQTRMHDSAEIILGRRTANKIDYKVNEHGANRKKEFTKECGKQFAIGTVAMATIVAGPAIVNMGKQALTNKRTYLYMNNLAVNQIAREAGLKTVSKGGIGRAGQCIKRGKKIAQAMMKAS